MQARQKESGQAVVEWALLTSLFTLLFIGVFAFAQWFCLRQQLLRVVKEGAFLFSSGRMPKEDVRRMMLRSLRQGHPPIEISPQAIYIGRSGHGQKTVYRLDEVQIRFRPKNLLRHVLDKEIKESCTIRHAPRYKKTLTLGIMDQDPPVPW